MFSMTLVHRNMYVYLNYEEYNFDDILSWSQGLQLRAVKSESHGDEPTGYLCTLPLCSGRRTLSTLVWVSPLTCPCGSPFGEIRFEICGYFLVFKNSLNKHECTLKHSFYSFEIYFNSSSHIRQQLCHAVLFSLLLHMRYYWCTSIELSTQWHDWTITDLFFCQWN